MTARERMTNMVAGLCAGEWPASFRLWDVFALGAVSGSLLGAAGVAGRAVMHWF